MASRVSARRPSNFFCLAKRSHQEKATPLSASPARLRRYGATSGARAGRGSAQTRPCGPQTVALPDPPAAALLGAATGALGSTRPVAVSLLLGGWRAVISSVGYALARTHFLGPRLRGDDGQEEDCGRRGDTGARLTRVIPAQAGIQSPAKRSEPLVSGRPPRRRGDGPSGPAPL